MSDKQEGCVKCGRTSAEIPLIPVRYTGCDFWICPQDIPILIHHPDRIPALAGAWTASEPPEPHVH